MKTIFSLIGLVAVAMSITSSIAQPVSRVQSIFPKETVTYANIAYANDTLKKHLLDIYLPAKAKENTPLVIWIHGGAWKVNDKYSDMSYMKNTVKSFIENGYALASIDYRYSTTAPFPAQIQDCNQAVEFLYKNASKYKLNKDKIALIGFSAGGHLASLLGLSNNNTIASFYAGKAASFKIKAVVDFYGASNLLLMAGGNESVNLDPQHPIVLLLGAGPLQRPDLAALASPVTYVDKNDPPFIIINGEKDESVPYAQSVLLSSWLTLAKVKNELIVVPNAPHYGEMFDVDSIREKVLKFLEENLK